MVVSVIVPVRNAGRDVEGLLEVLSQQTISPSDVEIVFADDGSTDGSLDVVRAGVPGARVVECEPKNAYSARNRAVGVARGEVLAFCDADCRPEPRWLEAGLAALETAEVVAGQIVLTVPERRGIWSLVDLDTFLDQERAVRFGAAVTANLFVRRELFDRVGGFDDSVPGHGDYEFVERCREAGARLVFSREAAVSHPARRTRDELLGKVREMHRSYAVRETSAGRRPDGLKLRSWVPIVPTLRARRRAGRSLGIDQRRLKDCNVSASLNERLAVLPLLYLVVPYVGLSGQLQGWLATRRTA